MTGSFQVPIARTNILEEEFESVLEPLKSGWLVQGPKVAEFEELWSEFTGAQYSIAVTSCTSAMHLSLAALGFQPGDEAIVPAFTWISTANVVEHMGGVVKFCDIELDTFNIDVSKVESLISEKTKVILPVHLFGLPANIQKINSLAQKYGLWVIEDAACGFGSKIDGQHVGTFGDTGCFSFHPRKSITTGEGGMVTTNNEQIAQRIRQYRDHGAEVSDRQRHLGPKPYLLSEHVVAGYNQRMTDIQAALAIPQLKRADKILSERKAIAGRYFESLSNLQSLVLPAEGVNNEHGYQSYPCLFRPKDISLENITEIHERRNDLMEKLLAAGVSTRPATHAVHMLHYYKNKYNLKPQDFKMAYFASLCSISFPFFNGMTEKEQSHVIASIKKHTN